MKNENRIFGLDPGAIKNPEQIDNLSEIDLYFAIEGLGLHIWCRQYEMAHNRSQNIDLTEQQFALEYLVYQTTKFGVDLPVPKKGYHIETTDSYNVWYKFYYNHFNNILSKEQFEKFQEKKLKGQNIEEFMPKGDWRDLLNEKSKTLSRLK